jgi:hypothetical protein
MRASLLDCALITASVTGTVQRGSSIDTYKRVSKTLRAEEIGILLI